MADVLTLITCTGGRPAAFALLERWIGEQVYWPTLEWIVVDDCLPRTPLTMGQVSIHNPVTWQPGAPPSLLANLSLGLQRARGEKILFIEDDECYLPYYLTNMEKALDGAHLAGQAPARYYNVLHRQYRVLPNTLHASLCQSGIRRELLPWMRDFAGSMIVPFIDVPLWRDHRKVASLDRQKADVLSIKGMPGRDGIGAGHRPPRGSWTPDLEGAWLELAVGYARANVYRSFFGSPQQRAAHISGFAGRV